MKIRELINRDLYESDSIDPKTETDVIAKLQQAMRDAGYQVGQTAAPSDNIGAAGPRIGTPVLGNVPSGVSGNVKPIVKPSTSLAGASANALFKGVNLMAVLYAIWQSYQMIAALDPNDPDWHEKASREVAHLIDAYGLPVVATILGGIVGGAFTGGPGSIPGIIMGMTTGVLADMALGDSAAEIVDGLVDKLFGKDSDSRKQIPGGNKPITPAMEHNTEITEDESLYRQLERFLGLIKDPEDVAGRRGQPQPGKSEVPSDVEIVSINDLPQDVKDILDKAKNLQPSALVSPDTLEKVLPPADQSGAQPDQAAIEKLPSDIKDVVQAAVPFDPKDTAPKDTPAPTDDNKPAADPQPTVNPDAGIGTQISAPTTAPVAPAGMQSGSPVPDSDSDAVGFGNKFKAARKAAKGPNGVFTYKGKQYQTNLKSEPYQPLNKLKNVDSLLESHDPIVDMFIRLQSQQDR